MVSRRNFLENMLWTLPVIAFPEAVRGAFQKKRSKVLILGDSISQGYFPYVKDLLKGKAHVYCARRENGNPENCEGTTKGVKNMDRWLGDTRWDVIHFNFGLHDLKHIIPETGGRSNDPGSPRQADLKQYKKNLKVIVKKLKATGAKLIFATTTPYPEDVENPLHDPGMLDKYNRAAVRIMNKNGIAVNDLHAFIKPKLNGMQRPGDLHFLPRGSEALGEKVSEMIESVL